MPKIIGNVQRVVELPNGSLTIDEYVGNVATQNDFLSIAHVNITQSTSEPWLTLNYDEWICILKGKIEFHYYYEENESESKQPQMLIATAGQTVFISKGERFRPIFPQGDTEYIPVCFPAFKPERCIREDDNEDGEVGSAVSQRLHELHHGKEEKKKDTTKEEEDKSSSEIIYHMCQQSLWEKAMTAKIAYFPPTFIEDGNFTHATAVPERLIDTANHFYTTTTGNWICLELNCETLKNKCGVITKFEEAKPVGTTNVSNTWQTWICPHIYGGIPGHISGIVTNIYPMKRNEQGQFLFIEGLTRS